MFTATDFDEAISGVAPGDVVGLKPTGGATFINLTAVDCTSSPSYTFHGFYAPVDNPPVVNVGRVGKTYPLKFSVTDESGATVSDVAAVQEVTTTRVKCAALCNLPTDKLEVTTSGGPGLSVDPTTGRFVYKWKASSRGCFTVTVVLSDGQSFEAYFRVR